MVQDILWQKTVFDSGFADEDYSKLQFHSIAENSKERLLGYQRAPEKQQTTETSMVIYLQLKDMRTKT